MSCGLNQSFHNRLRLNVSISATDMNLAHRSNHQGFGERVRKTCVLIDVALLINRIGVGCDNVARIKIGAEPAETRLGPVKHIFQVADRDGPLRRVVGRIVDAADRAGQTFRTDHDHVGSPALQVPALQISCT
jgi:hypothetical protein